VRRSGRNIPDIPEKLVKNRGVRIEIVAGVGHCIAVTPDINQGLFLLNSLIVWST